MHDSSIKRISFAHSKTGQAVRSASTITHYKHFKRYGKKRAGKKNNPVRAWNKNPEPKTLKSERKTLKITKVRTEVVKMFHFVAWLQNCNGLIVTRA